VYCGDDRRGKELAAELIRDVGFDPVGSYDGGRMLFLGLGTGLGSTLITENVIVPLELGELPYGDEERLGLLVGRRGLKRIGKPKWRGVVCDMLDSFARAFVVDYIVLGGGNAKLIKELPKGVRLGATSPRSVAGSGSGI
jgi:polyphosphate glucokinase